MNGHIFRWGVAVCAILGIGAIALMDHDFDTDSPLFYIGLTLIIVTSIAAHAIMNAYHHYNLTDEFDAGYRVGYRAGRRAALGAVPQGLVVPMRKRENLWPDTGDYPVESSKQP